MSILADHGFAVSYIDCLDRFHSEMPLSDPNNRYGCGAYLKTLIHRPNGMDDVSRNFSRYGILPKWFKQDLLSKPKPDIVFVTSFMTYWHTGVKETITVIKEIFPKTPIILGGIYATLCYDHAKKHSGADYVVAGQATRYILELAEKYTNFSTTPKFDADNLDTYPYPAFNLQRKITYVPILTSVGCPFSCTYCASHFLNPNRMMRSPESVVEEIKYWHKKYGVIDFVFYDDALLINAEKHAIPIFEQINESGLNIRFHTPNAVHIRSISKTVAHLMFKAGFKTLRLGLETTAFDTRNKIDKKVTLDEFIKAVDYLKKAGFDKNQIGAYLLAGLPNQSMNSIKDSINVVKQNDITPIIAYYSPIPHTALWSKAVACSRYDLEADPIFTNNAILPCTHKPFSWKTISYLKDLVKV